jgi:hypothetical protein
MVKQIKTIKTKRKNSLSKTIKEKYFKHTKRIHLKVTYHSKKFGKGEGKA